MKNGFKWKNNKWNVGLWWGDHHPDRDVFWYGDSVSKDSDGNLVLDVVRHPKEFDGKMYHYSVGCVQDVNDYKYGLFRWWCKLPKGKGVWPALWLASRQSWPPEIDCMEGWSRTDKATYRKGLFKFNIHPTVHWGDTENHKQNRGRRAGLLSLCEDKVNEFAILWLPKYVFVLYNGWVVGQFNDKEMLKQLNEEGITMSPIMSINVTPNGESFDYQDYLKNGSPMIVYDYEYIPLEKVEVDPFYYEPYEFCSRRKKMQDEKK